MTDTLTDYDAWKALDGSGHWANDLWYPNIPAVVHQVPGRGAVVEVPLWCYAMFHSVKAESPLPKPWHDPAFRAHTLHVVATMLELPGAADVIQATCALSGFQAVRDIVWNGKHPPLYMAGPW